MPVKTDVKIYQDQNSNLKDLRNINITEVPLIVFNPDEYETEIIDKIKNQPLPNKISEETQSDAIKDIKLMVEFLGTLTKPNSMEEIKDVVKRIHDTFGYLKTNRTGISNTRNWVKFLTGLHPKLDDYMKNNLKFWKKFYSELIGTNTILYYADEHAIDLMYWSKTPAFKTNTVKWFLSAWGEPSYLRENIRHKLDKSIVEYIQDSAQITQRHLRRNIIWDARTTTKRNTGGEIAQNRPIGYKTAHGVSLNSDWYHQTYRIMPGKSNNKWFAWNDLLFKLSNDNDGWFVHVMINHMNPLKPVAVSQNKLINFKSPIGVEETFPTKGDEEIEYTVALNGQRIISNENEVNNDMIEPNTEIKAKL